MSDGLRAVTSLKYSQIITIARVSSSQYFSKDCLMASRSSSGVLFFSS
ncbi:MAG: hypothetical protein R6W85_02410 [Gillisia sp.]